tara:strand:- start:5280 stop:5408 length:129 start_codon:yes stop_codon:yes gene_type:complete
MKLFKEWIKIKTVQKQLKVLAVIVIALVVALQVWQHYMPGTV